MLHNDLKIEEEKYSVLELWPYLEDLIKKHDVIKDMQASSEEDEKAFTAIIETMHHMHRLGCEARDLNWWWPPNIPKKAHLARDTGNVFEEHFGPSKLPPLAGEKSLKYVLDVIIPFMTFTASLRNEWWVRIACDIVSINFEEKVAQAKALVGKNWDNVRAYEVKKQSESLVGRVEQTPNADVSRGKIADTSEALIHGNTPKLARKVSVTSVGHFAQEQGASEVKQESVIASYHQPKI